MTFGRFLTFSSDYSANSPTKRNRSEVLSLFLSALVFGSLVDFLHFFNPAENFNNFMVATQKLQLSFFSPYFLSSFCSFLTSFLSFFLPQLVPFFSFFYLSFSFFLCSVVRSFLPYLVSSLLPSLVYSSLPSFFSSFLTSLVAPLISYSVSFVVCLFLTYLPL